MRWWKAVGMAGAAGVVATGVVVVRSERRRRAYTPDQVREQLHVRFAQAESAEHAVEPDTPAAADSSRLRNGFRDLSRRFAGAARRGRAALKRRGSSGEEG